MFTPVRMCGILASAVRARYDRFPKSTNGARTKSLCFLYSRLHDDAGYISGTAGNRSKTPLTNSDFGYNKKSGRDSRQRSNESCPRFSSTPDQFSIAPNNNGSHQKYLGKTFRLDKLSSITQSFRLPTPSLRTVMVVTASESPPS